MIVECVICKANSVVYNYYNFKGGYYDMCGVVCIKELLHQNSYLHNYTYITCHTKQTPIAICNSPLHHSYILFNNSFNYGYC